LRFVFLNSNTLNAHVNDFCVRDRFFKAHLKKANVRYRGPNQCRHTFACQLLSTGEIPAEWISQQLGHTNPTTTFKYYAKWMSSNAADMVQKAEAALGV
jgi:integrase